MPKIYRLSKTGLRLFYKIRHHRGHGIHSPFVFNLITRVIEEKLPYYAYNDIKNLVRNCPHVKQKVNKSNLLSFRLVNYFNAKTILEIGSGNGVNTLHLTAADSRATCHSVELSPEKIRQAQSLYKNWDRCITLHFEKLPDLNEKQDCICIDLKNYNAEKEELIPYVFNLITDSSFVIVKGIRTNKRHQLLWRSLRQADKVTVSVDLFHEGILFFDPKLFKRNYRLSF